MELTPEDIRALREWKSWLRTNGQRATRLDYSTPLPPRLLQKHTDETINVYNNTGQTIPKYGVLELDGTVYNEAELDLPPDVKSAVYNAIAPVILPAPANASVPLWNKRICILQQELEDGEQGKAKINGITPVKVYSETNQNPFQAHVCKDQPTNRLRAEWVNSGYGFPILWRERGVGEKWALVDLKWFDAPGFFVKRPVIKATLGFPVTTVLPGEDSYGKPYYVLEGSGGSFTGWGNTTDSAGSLLNTAAGVKEDSTGLRIQGRGVWLGRFTAQLIYRYAVSSTSNQTPYIEHSFYQNSDGTNTNVGAVRVKVLGDNVFQNDFAHAPAARLVKIGYVPIGGLYMLADIINVDIPFYFLPSNTAAANVVSPIQIRISIANHKVTLGGTAPSTSPSAYQPIQTVQIGWTSFMMHEVNPYVGRSTGWDLGGGGFETGITPGASVGYGFPSFQNPDDGSSDPLSTSAISKITETLSSPFGGIIATPEP